MNEDDFAELAAGHALHALSPEDERDYTAALVAHPEWAHLAETDAATAVALADTVADATPPAALRSALLAQIARLPQDADAAHSPAAASAAVTAASEAAVDPTPDTETIQTAARRNWTRGLLALAASCVLLLGLGFGAVLIGQQLNRPASVVALEQIEAAPDAQSASVSLEDGGDATAHWSGSLGKAVLVTDGLPSITEDQSFELWFVRDGTPISAGVFDAEDGEATAELAGEMHAGDVIAVTVEQAGGSPSGEPTTDPIVAIPTA